LRRASRDARVVEGTLSFANPPLSALILIWRASLDSPEIRSGWSASFQLHPNVELRPESPDSPRIPARQGMVFEKRGVLATDTHVTRVALPACLNEHFDPDELNSC